MTWPARSDPRAVAWASFVRLLVNIPARLADRPGLTGSLGRQAALSHVLWLCSLEPRLAVPISGVPQIRADWIPDLLEARELLAWTASRGRACVAPVALLEAARELSPQVQRELISDAGIARGYLEWAAEADPASGRLAEAARHRLAAARDATARLEIAAAIAAASRELGIAGLASGLPGSAPGVAAPALLDVDLLRH